MLRIEAAQLVHVLQMTPQSLLGLNCGFWIRDDVAGWGLPFPHDASISGFTPGVSLKRLPLKTREGSLRGAPLIYFSSSSRLVGLSNPPSPSPSTLDKLPAGETHELSKKVHVCDTGNISGPWDSFFPTFWLYFCISGLKLQHTTVSFTVEN